MISLIGNRIVFGVPVPMRFSIFLALAGILVWILVTVWDFVAPELIATLFWARLATPVICIILIILAVLLR
jgi:hypothetical protein